MKINMKLVGPVLILAGIVGMASFAYPLVTSFTTHETGSVQMVRAFLDQNCTQPVTTINWGDVLPNTTITRTVWIKNFAAKTVNLTMTVGNWTPTNAQDYMHVYWDREGETLTSGFVLNATLSLRIFANMTDSTISTFSFDRVFNENW